MRLPKSLTSWLVAFAAASWPRSTSIMPPSAALFAESASAPLSGAVDVTAVVAVVPLVPDVSVAVVAVLFADAVDDVVAVSVVAVVSLFVLVSFLQANANRARNANRTMML